MLRRDTTTKRNKYKTQERTFFGEKTRGPVTSSTKNEFGLRVRTRHDLGSLCSAWDPTVIKPNSSNTSCIPVSFFGISFGVVLLFVILFVIIFITTGTTGSPQTASNSLLL